MSTNNEKKKPHVGVDEFGFIPEELRVRHRWAGVWLESYPKFMEVIRLKHVDIKTGWGASADDSDSLTSFGNVVHALRAGKIHHFVYMPESGADMATVEEMNKKLCPVDLPGNSRPTYRELLAEDPMHIDFAKDGEVDVSNIIPHLAQLVMLHVLYEKSIVRETEETLLRLLNKQQVSGREKTVYGEFWIKEGLKRAFEGKQHIMVYSLLEHSVRISRIIDKPFPAASWNNVWYQFERLR